MKSRFSTEDMTFLKEKIKWDTFKINSYHWCRYRNRYQNHQGRCGWRLFVVYRWCHRWRQNRCHSQNEEVADTRRWSVRIRGNFHQYQIKGIRYRNPWTNWNDGTQRSELKVLLKICQENEVQRFESRRFKIINFPPLRQFQTFCTRFRQLLLRFC